MKILIENIEDVENIILEDSENPSKKNFWIKGPHLNYNIENKNKRIYEEHIMRKGVDEYINEYINNNRAIGTLEHENHPTPSLDKVSHRTTLLDFRNPNEVYGESLILNTPCGKIAKGLMEGGVKLGVSSRALGSLKSKNGKNYVQEDFSLKCIDIVSSPSGPSCFVNGIMENKEWVYVNDVGWIEQLIEETKQEINNTIKQNPFNKKQIQQMGLIIFENFMKKL